MIHLYYDICKTEKTADRLAQLVEHRTAVSIALSKTLILMNHLKISKQNG